MKPRTTSFQHTVLSTVVTNFKIHHLVLFKITATQFLSHSQNQIKLVKTCLYGMTLTSRMNKRFESDKI